jgi:alkylation response protein AidB-like acyl-CoA dehydrogenase
VERDVDFSFSPEHDELRSMVRKLFSSSSTNAPKETWTQLAELGLIGLAVPTDHGGSGGGLIDLGIVMEEAGRSLSPAPLLSNAVLAPAAVLAADDDALNDEVLPALADGSLTAGIALNAHGRIESQETVTVTKDRGGCRLEGTAPLVLDGATADVLVLPVSTGAGSEVFLAEAGAAGVTRGCHENLDASRAIGHVALRDVPARRLGEAGSGSAILARLTDVSAAMIAAEAVGGAARTLDLTVEYASTRHQFGRPIGSFQAVKHMCADMLLQLEAARSAAYYALWAVETGAPDQTLAATIAKTYASDAFHSCAARCVQVHGGIGFTWEHPAHRYLKRAKADQLMFGNSAWHLEQVARSVGI